MLKKESKASDYPTIAHVQKTFENNILLDEITDIIKSNGEVILRAKGQSMRPFIRDGVDSVMLKRADSVTVGDVVLANVGTAETHHYVLHRVFSISGDKVTLMGDGNIRGREYCRISDISAKAVSVIRPSGREFKMPKGVLWRKLLPVRRYLLAIYVRLPKFMK